MAKGGTSRRPSILSRWSSCMFDCLSSINGTKHVLPALNLALRYLARRPDSSNASSSRLFAYRPPMRTR